MLDIYISLTSIPPRYSFINQTIKSIKNQSFQVKKNYY